MTMWREGEAFRVDTRHSSWMLTEIHTQQIIYAAGISLSAKLAL